MKITILCLGKLKETYWREAEGEYLKRLGPYAKVEVVELKEEAFRDGDSVEVVQRKEAKRILEKLETRSLKPSISAGRLGTLIALHERGKEFDSVGFANFLEKRTEAGGEVVFVIGGPKGLHASVLERVDYQLSMSQLTFPHQMVRTILMEQVYRAVTIMNGKKYHY